MSLNDRMRSVKTGTFRRKWPLFFFSLNLFCQSYNLLFAIMKKLTFMTLVNKIQIKNVSAKSDLSTHDFSLLYIQYNTLKVTVWCKECQLNESMVSVLLLYCTLVFLYTRHHLALHECMVVIIVSKTETIERLNREAPKAGVSHLQHPWSNLDPVSTEKKALGAGNTF